MGLFNLFLIPYFLFQISTKEARNVIIDFYNRNYDAMTHYVETGDKSKILFDDNRTVRLLEELMDKKGKSGAIEKIEEEKEYIERFFMYRAKIVEKDDNSFMLYMMSGKDSCRYGLDKRDEGWRVAVINPFKGIVHYIGNYLSEQEHVEPRTEIVDMHEWIRDDNYDLEFRVSGYTIHWDDDTPFVDVSFKVRNTEEDIRYNFFDARLLDSDNYRTKPAKERFFEMNDLESSTVFLGPDYSSKSVILPFYAASVTDYSVFLLPTNDKRIRIDLGEIPPGLFPK